MPRSPLAADPGSFTLDTHVPETPPPADTAFRALALILCDQVIREAITNKISIIGAFSNIRAASVPITLPRLGFYASLMGPQREAIPVVMSLVHEGGEESLRIAGELTILDANQAAELPVNVGAVTLSRFGRYTLRLDAMDRRLLERPLVVEQAPAASTGEPAHAS